MIPAPDSQPPALAVRLSFARVLCKPSVQGSHQPPHQRSLSLDRRHIVSAPLKLPGDLRAEHLVEEQLHLGDGSCAARQAA
jgi:hypothetical protein